MSAKTLLFIPTYNEAENVPIIYRELKALGLDMDVRFCDDNSPDGTGEIIDALALKDARLSVMHRSGKLGIGSAHQEGIRYAYQHGYDVLITMDCDFAHSPSYIKDFIAQEKGDIVIGSRYMQQDSLNGWNLYRKLLTHLGHWMTVLLLKMPYDATGAFRLYRLKRIDPALFSLVRSGGYSFFFESLYVLMVNRLNIVEVPIALPPRTYGHSKMTMGNLGTSLRVLGQLFKRKLFQPKSFYLNGHPTETIREAWDNYWHKPRTISSRVYDHIAAFYRTAIIRPALTHYMGAYFDRPQAKLLHAGCGSGQVEGDLSARYQITALDISPRALELYRHYNPQVNDIVLGDIFDLSFPAGSMEGVYNLGVMEHFDEMQIDRILANFHRVLKPGGKIVLFWPPAYGLATNVLKCIEGLKLFPQEITHVRGRGHASHMLEKAGFELVAYHFGPRDLWTHAVVVARKKEDT